MDHMPFWQQVVLAIIIGSATIMASIPSFLAWKSGQKTAKAVENVHVSINSRMDQLLKVFGDAKFAEGVKSEVDRKGGASSAASPKEGVV